MKRISRLAPAFATLCATAVLFGWMLARVAEHPGITRDVGALPPWFAAGDVRRGKAESEAHSAALPVAAGQSAVEENYADVVDGKVEIAFTEYEFKPSRIRVPPGKVTFVLRNEGRYAHDFHVEGVGVDAYAARFGPGRVVHLEATLQEGEYKISCPLSNHDERGMHGKLIATSRLAAK